MPELGADTSLPGLVLGGRAFGRGIDGQQIDDAFALIAATGSREVDVCHMPGAEDAEAALGLRLGGLSLVRADLYITTKVDPQGRSGRVSLRPEEVRRQLDATLQRLQTDYVDLLILHRPDNETPIELTLQACAELHTEGKLRQLGLSGYAAWQVAEAYHACDREGWLLPSVYQGPYNVITRQVEAELIPCLHHLGMAFYACSPLAAGLIIAISGNGHRQVSRDHNRASSMGHAVGRLRQASEATLLRW